MLPDIEIFTAVVRAEHRDFFADRRPITVARAPLALDVLGGGAEVAGGLALGLPLGAAVLAALQPDPEPRIALRVRAPGHGLLAAAIPLAALAPGGAPLEYEQARALLGNEDWQIAPHAPLSSAFGCWLALMREEFVPFEAGARLLVELPVPWGSNLGEGAALEIAVTQALAAVRGVRAAPRELALVCQLAAERLGGDASGLAARVTAACGAEGHILALRCQPAWIDATPPLPPGLGLWGIAVPGDPGAADVRAAAAMAYRIVAGLAGLPVLTRDQGSPLIDDRRWGGYLVNIGPAEFARSFCDRLPVQISGAEFLDRYGTMAGSLPAIDPTRGYPLRAIAAYLIGEHFRARSFAALLRSARDEQLRDEAARLMGELLAQSHEEARACGLVSAPADRLVDLVRAAGAVAGVFGVRAVAGGSGSVVVLGRAGAASAVDAVAHHYAAETGGAAQVLGGSSPGAAAAGVRDV